MLYLHTFFILSIGMWATLDMGRMLYLHTFFIPGLNYFH
jgi:hypothetical protein